MKYLDLFSGYGGFSLGIQQAYEATRSSNVSEKRGGEETSQGVNEKGERLHTLSSQATLPTNDRNNELPDTSIDQGQPHCIGFCEIDKYATQVYKHKFPTHKEYGDITKLDPKELPDFDLLTAGFPCQAFSIAGKRMGFEDTRGTLIYDVFRIIKEKHPKYVLLENVKGLLSHDKGRTFKTIITSLAELGYAVEWQVLNAKNFGVPQNRERVFIVGHLGGFGGRQVFPIGGEPTEDTRRTGKEISYTIDASYAKGTNTIEKSRRQIIQVNKPKPNNDRVYDKDGISPTLNTMQGGNRQPFITGGLQKHAATMENQSTALTSAMGQGGGHTPILNAIRRLTPTECERLMGLPDGWTAEGTEGKISDTQRYKLCGNGLVPQIVTEIVKKLTV